MPVCVWLDWGYLQLRIYAKTCLSHGELELPLKAKLFAFRCHDSFSLAYQASGVPLAGTFLVGYDGLSVDGKIQEMWWLLAPLPLPAKP